MTWPVKIGMAALALIDLLALAGILASPIMIFTSLLLFASPASASKLVVWGMALGIWSYPLSAGVGGVNGLKAYKARNARGQLRWTLCAISSVVLYEVSVLLGALDATFR